ncbi:MAG: FMN-binding protein, partial [Bacteroidales bacterium]|nr:FMN-binding protein [Bacteroidales bacterium]
MGKKAPLVLGTDIDAVSGATITSMAIVDAVNELLIYGPRPLEEPVVYPVTEPAKEEPVIEEKNPAEQAAETASLTLTKTAYDDEPITVTVTADADGLITSLT